MNPYDRIYQPHDENDNVYEGQAWLDAMNDPDADWDDDCCV
jgi:hypothetical protein